MKLMEKWSFAQPIPSGYGIVKCHCQRLEYTIAKKPFHLIFRVWRMFVNE